MDSSIWLPGLVQEWCGSADAAEVPEPTAEIPSK